MTIGPGARWAVAMAMGTVALGVGAVPAAAAKDPKIGSKQANRMVAKQLAEQRFVGSRGDGAGVDWTFCADGRFTSAVTSGGSTGTSDGASWKVVDAKVRKNGTWFEAVVEGSGGWSVAVGRRGAQYLAAVDWTPFEFGTVTRSAAGEACA